MRYTYWYCGNAHAKMIKVIPIEPANARLTRLCTSFRYIKFNFNNKFKSTYAVLIISGSIKSIVKY